MKKFISVLCGAVVAVCAAATAAFGGINGYSAKAENAAENQKFALDTGAYTLKMDDSVTMDVSYAHGAYLYNKRDTSGNIPPLQALISTDLSEEAVKILHTLIYP